MGIFLLRHNPLVASLEGATYVHWRLNVFSGISTTTWRLSPVKWTANATAKRYCTELTDAIIIEGAGKRGIINSAYHSEGRRGLVIPHQLVRCVAHMATGTMTRKCIVQPLVGSLAA
jgi:hypothetical protein